MSTVSSATNPWVTASIVCNYIPGLSVLSNLVELVLKCVYKCMPRATPTPGTYWNYITTEKQTAACIFFSFVPVISNIALYVACIYSREWQKFDSLY